MKRLLFVVLLMVCSVSWAEWEFLSKSSDGEQKVYVNKSTIRKNGAISRMWVLTDFSQVQTNAGGERYMSDMTLTVYNCRDETVEIVSLVEYSGSMGQGNVVEAHTWQEREWKWEPNVPGSFGETLWKIACGKK